MRHAFVRNHTFPFHLEAAREMGAACCTSHGTEVAAMVAKVNGMDEDEKGS